MPPPVDDRHDGPWRPSTGRGRALTETANPPKDGGAKARAYLRVYPPPRTRQPARRSEVTARSLTSAASGRRGRRCESTPFGALSAGCRREVAADRVPGNRVPARPGRAPAPPLPSLQPRSLEHVPLAEPFASIDPESPRRNTPLGPPRGTLGGESIDHTRHRGPLRPRGESNDQPGAATPAPTGLPTHIEREPSGCT